MTQINIQNSFQKAFHFIYKFKNTIEVLNNFENILLVIYLYIYFATQFELL